MLSKKESSKVSYIEIPASMDSWECWVDVTEPKILESSLDELLLESGFNILDKMIHYFPVKGFTAIWLLAESHLAIHTFPESEKSYLQISSCNTVKLNSFKELLSNSNLLSLV
jgi:S-adenosylmethionine decarboxylase